MAGEIASRNWCDRIGCDGVTVYRRGALATASAPRNHQQQGRTAYQDATLRYIAGLRIQLRKGCVLCYAFSCSPAQSPVSSLPQTPRRFALQFSRALL